MSSNFTRPERWFDLAAGLMRGDASVAGQIVEYERQADNIFQQYGPGDFSPRIVQGGNTRTYTTDLSHFFGYRIGPLVHLNFFAQINNSPGGSGAFNITVPTDLPINEGAFGIPTIGRFWVRQGGVRTSGDAVSNSDYTVLGWLSGESDYMGAGAPVITLASGDQAGYTISYITSANL